MRPMLGKTKFWEKPPVKEPIYKYAVVKYWHAWHDPNYWETQGRWVYGVYKDTEDLKIRAQISDYEIVMQGLTEKDANMWAKMME